MSGTQRWLLPAGALVLLARSLAVPLPASWVVDPAAVDPALLAQLDDLPDSTALTPWRTPVVTLRVLLAPLGSARPVPSTGPAAALEAHLTVGEAGLVTLVRRDGVELVELTAAPATAIAEELDRVLDVLDGTAGRGGELRASRDLFAELCETPSTAHPLGALLGRASRVLETTLVAADGTLTGGLWYDADGWWRVEVDEAEVVLRPGAPRSPDWAPLLDQVLA